MKKITILALHLGYGGIEKCISTLANSLKDEYDINIISTYKLYDESTNIFKKGNYVLCDHYEDEKRDACDLIWLDVNETKEELEALFAKAEIDLVPTIK